MIEELKWEEKLEPILQQFDKWNNNDILNLNRWLNDLIIKRGCNKTAVGGNNNNYRQLYIREKARYLCNKQRQNGGGCGDKTEQLYKQTKNEYLALKNQLGGTPNYEQLYKQKKNEYLALKNKLNK